MTVNKIETFEQYRTMTKEFRRAAEKVTGNCYFMPAEVKKYTEEGKLFYERQEGMLLFYVDEETYFHVYYYLDEKACPRFCRQDKTAILDFVCRKDKLEEIRKEEEKWRRAGFSLYKEYVRMCYKPEEGKRSLPDADCVKAEPFARYRFEKGNASYHEQILRLWEKNLDLLSTPLPKSGALCEMLEEGHVYYILDGEKVVGALYLDVTGKACLLQHIVIDPAYRKQGLGVCLLNYAFSCVKGEVAVCNLWVDVENLPAYNMYRKYGFVEEGLLSKQYLYEG